MPRHAAPQLRIIVWRQPQGEITAQFIRAPHAELHACQIAQITDAITSALKDLVLIPPPTPRETWQQANPAAALEGDSKE